MEKIILAQPRGFCAGVDRAIEIVERSLEKFGKPIYVRHAIVHNDHVVKDLEEKGAIFVEEIEEIPSGNYVIFSAHGSEKELRDKALDRGLKPIDAVCPLVTKVHNEANRYGNENYTIVYLGHKGHQEAVGSMSRAKMILVENVEDVKKLEMKEGKKMILTQTTLSLDDTQKVVEALKSKYPEIEERRDICYATTNRQNAIKEMAKKAEVILVVGSKTSSNSNRLVSTAEDYGAKGYLVNDKSEVLDEWLSNVKVVGITSGASGPEHLVQDLVKYLQEKYKCEQVDELVISEENAKFGMPAELQ